MTIENSAVKEVFDSYDEKIRARLLKLRKMVLEVAAHTNGVGELEETLKWKEPAYLTSQSGSGTTIRLAPVRNKPGKYAVFFNCKTSLLDTFRALYSDVFSFDGNRALVFDVNEKLPTEPLKHCIAMALTYHQRSNPAGSQPLQPREPGSPVPKQWPWQTV